MKKTIKGGFMKQLLKLVVISALIPFAAITAKADRLRLGTPGYGGTGCPAGSAQVNVSPDDTAVSVLFDSYVAEAGRTNGRTIDRKSCNLTIPVHVPQGYSVAIFHVDYRGYNAVPSGGRSQFNAEYFWAGSRGPTMTRTFMGPLNQNYILSNDLLASTLVWAPCGASVNLRINSSMMAQTNSRMDQTMATVDSADLSSGLIYHLQWRRCN
jgi:hypothetical protein